MDLVITITLFVVAVASIAANVLQLIERKQEIKEKNRVIAESARLEVDYEKLQRELADSQQHVSWALGRIKDQQAVITILKNNTKPNNKGRFSANKRDNNIEQSEQ